MGAQFTTQGLEALKTGLERQVADGSAPGAVGLVDRAGETHVFAVGEATLGGPPMRRDTLFRVTSMTKPVTAAAVMMLVEDGRLALDEPVDRLLPELAGRRVLARPDGPLDETVPARRPITVEDLLTFRMGLGLMFGPPTTPILKAIADLQIVGFGPPDPRAPYGPDTWMARLGSLPLMAQPGEDWRYTTASDVQGVLVARASGQPLETFFRERIFEPLGMADAGFHVPADKIGRLATAYVSRDGRLQVFDEPAGAFAQPPRFAQGDGGLCGGLDDFLAFSRMLLNRGEANGARLLSDASVAAMTVNHLTPEQARSGRPFLDEGFGWGYGMAVATADRPDGSRRGAFGWSGGFGTSWQMDPASGLTAMLFTQRLLDSPASQDIHDRFRRAAYAALA